MDVITQFYITVGLMVFSGLVGFYMGERGLTGVRIDLANTKNEIEKVKNLVTPKTVTQTATVPAPVESRPVTDTVTVTTTPSI